MDGAAIYIPEICRHRCTTQFHFLRRVHFRWQIRVAIGRVMMALLQGVPKDTPENFAHWLVRHGQTRASVDRFWRPLMHSALNDDLDRLSVRYAGMVIRSSFMSSPIAGRMGFPTIPLSDLYSHALQYIRARGGDVLLRTSAEGFSFHAENRALAVTGHGNGQSAHIDAGAVILALPFEATQKLLPALPALAAGTQNKLPDQLAHFEHSPITGIHFWFDRKITDLPHAVLLDTTIQWMFNKSLLQPQTRAEDCRGLSGVGGECIEDAGADAAAGDSRSCADVSWRNSFPQSDRQRS